MQIRIESKGNFDNLTKWLKESSTRTPDDTLQSIGIQGTQMLAGATPVGETGETARGWQHKVTKTSRGAEVAFMNTAHPEAGVNIAKLIDQGHGTGTGGYVPPRPYIKSALNQLFSTAPDRLAKEMFK